MPPRHIAHAPPGTTVLDATTFRARCSLGWLTGRDDRFARKIGHGFRAVPSDYYDVVVLVSSLWGGDGKASPALVARLRDDPPFRRAVLSLAAAIDFADTRTPTEKWRGPTDRSALRRFLLMSFTP